VNRSATWPVLLSSVSDRCQQTKNGELAGGILLMRIENQDNHAAVAQAQSHVPRSAGECRSRRGNNCPRDGARLTIGPITLAEGRREVVQVCHAPLLLGQGHVHTHLGRFHSLNRSFRHEEDGVARNIHPHDPEHLGQGRS
jgi:hypothetical protein